MKVVLDTNVLVSALRTPGRNATKIMNAVFSGQLQVCYDNRIFEEYVRVLYYPRLKIGAWEAESMLDQIVSDGISIIPDPITDVSFERDETDRKFYEVAKFCNAILITGNLKHYPEDPDIMLMADFVSCHM